MTPKHAKSRRLWPYLAVPATAMLVALTIYMGDFSAEDVGLGGVSGQSLPGSQADQSAMENSSLKPDPEEVHLAAENQLQGRLDEAVTAYLDELADDNLYVSVAVDNGEYHLDHNGEEQHESASIVKVEILTMMLRKYGTVDEVPGWIMGAAERMIKDSDNGATNDIYFSCWSDPDAEIAQAHQDFGLEHTEPHESERWGQTLTTANDQLTILEAALFEGVLTTEQAEVSRELMGDLADFQEWGVDAAAREGETVWMKNGWDTRDAVGGEWVVHSIGVIAGDTDQPIKLSILTSGSASEEEGIERVERLAAIAREVIDVDPYA